MASGGTTGSLLVCRVGSKLCALPLGCLLETMRPLSTEPLPQAPDFVAGVAVIRGRPTPVIDARKLLDGKSEHAPGRYVTLDVDRRGERVAALAVDAIVGVREVTDGVLAALPSLLRAPDGGVLAGFGMLDAELLLVLEQARLVPEEVWKQLDQNPVLR